MSLSIFEFNGSVVALAIDNRVVVASSRSFPWVAD